METLYNMYAFERVKDFWQFQESRKGRENIYEMS
jgi:hypothetical protein